MHRINALATYRILTVWVPNTRRVSILVNLVAEIEPPVLVNWLKAFHLVDSQDTSAALFDTLALIL
jgi:hypothetical protein